VFDVDPLARRRTWLLLESDFVFAVATSQARAVLLVDAVVRESGATRTKGTATAKSGEDASNATGDTSGRSLSDRGCDDGRMNLSDESVELLVGIDVDTRGVVVLHVQDAHG
jgi:hypothetical protein